MSACREEMLVVENVRACCLCTSIVKEIVHFRDSCREGSPGVYPGPQGKVDETPLATAVT